MECSDTREILLICQHNGEGGNERSILVLNTVEMDAGIGYTSLSSYVSNLVISFLSICSIRVMQDFKSHFLLVVVYCMQHVVMCFAFGASNKA